jgi:hypothetical protein
VSVRRSEVDASSVAVDRVGSARIGARSTRAYRADRAADVTRSAVLRIARAIDARVAARGEAVVAARTARAVLADGDAVGRRRATHATFPAIRWVALDVHAGAVAGFEPFATRVFAATVIASGGCARRRRANRTTGTAILGIAREHSAASRTHGFALRACDGAAELRGTNTDISLGIADVPVHAASGVVAAQALERVREIARTTQEYRGAREEERGESATQVTHEIQ